MAFQAVPNGALAVLHGRVDGQDVMTTLGFGLITPGTISKAMADDLALGVYNKWLNNAIPELPAAYGLLKCVVNILAVQDGPEAEYDPAESIPGELSGATLPNSNSLAIAFKTGLHGRTNRGRNYWPLFLESEVTANLVAVLKAAAIEAIYEALVGPNTVATGWVWSVISRKIIDISGYGLAVPITEVMFNDLVIDSQRRRLPGRGR